MTNKSITIITHNQHINYYRHIRFLARITKVIAKTEYATVYSVDKRFVQKRSQKLRRIATIIHGKISFVN